MKLILHYTWRHKRYLLLSMLGVAGFGLLYFYTNMLAVLFAVLGFVIYVGLYSLYLKRKSVYGTLIGSLSGAAPPVIGYCAVSNQFDAGAGNQSGRYRTHAAQGPLGPGCV